MLLCVCVYVPSGSFTVTSKLRISFCEVDTVNIEMRRSQIISFTDSSGNFTAFLSDSLCLSSSRTLEKSLEFPQTMSNVDSLLSELDGILGDEFEEDRSYGSRAKKRKNSYSEDADIDSLLEATDFSSS